MRVFVLFKRRMENIANSGSGQEIYDKSGTFGAG